MIFMFLILFLSLASSQPNSQSSISRCSCVTPSSCHTQLYGRLPMDIALLGLYSPCPTHEVVLCCDRSGLEHLYRDSQLSVIISQVMDRGRDGHEIDSQVTFTAGPGTHNADPNTETKRKQTLSRCSCVAPSSCSTQLYGRRSEDIALLGSYSPCFNYGEVLCCDRSGLELLYQDSQLSVTDSSVTARGKSTGQHNGVFRETEIEVYNNKVDIAHDVTAGEQVKCGCIPRGVCLEQFVRVSPDLCGGQLDLELCCVPRQLVAIEDSHEVQLAAGEDSHEVQHTADEQSHEVQLTANDSHEEQLAEDEDNHEVQLTKDEDSHEVQLLAAEDIHEVQLAAAEDIREVQLAAVEDSHEEELAATEDSQDAQLPLAVDRRDGQIVPSSVVYQPKEKKVTSQPVTGGVENIGRDQSTRTITTPTTTQPATADSHNRYSLPCVADTMCRQEYGLSAREIAQYGVMPGCVPPAVRCVTTLDQDGGAVAPVGQQIERRHQASQSTTKDETELFTGQNVKASKNVEIKDKLKFPIRKFFFVKSRTSKVARNEVEQDQLSPSQGENSNTEPYSTTTTSPQRSSHLPTSRSSPNLTSAELSYQSTPQVKAGNQSPPPQGTPPLITLVPCTPAHSCPGTAYSPLSPQHRQQYGVLAQCSAGMVRCVYHLDLQMFLHEDNFNLPIFHVKDFISFLTESNREKSENKKSIKYKHNLGGLVKDGTEEGKVEHNDHSFKFASEKKVIVPGNSHSSLSAKSSPTSDKQSQDNNSSQQLAEKYDKTASKYKDTKDRLSSRKSLFGKARTSKIVSKLDSVMKTTNTSSKSEGVQRYVGLTSGAGRPDSEPSHITIASPPTSSHLPTRSNPQDSHSTLSSKVFLTSATQFQENNSSQQLTGKNSRISQHEDIKDKLQFSSRKSLFGKLRTSKIVNKLEIVMKTTNTSSESEGAQRDVGLTSGAGSPDTEPSDTITTTSPPTSSHLPTPEKETNRTNNYQTLGSIFGSLRRKHIVGEKSKTIQNHKPVRILEQLRENLTMKKTSSITLQHVTSTTPSTAADHLIIAGGSQGDHLPVQHLPDASEITGVEILMPTSQPAKVRLHMDKGMMELRLDEEQLLPVLQALIKALDEIENM